MAPMSDAEPPGGPPTERDLRRWRRYLADERAEAATYRDLAARRGGDERAILLALADAEKRHEEHWLTLLGDDVGKPRRAEPRTRALAYLARRFGSVFVLALAQGAESRAVYENERDATPRMMADERIHAEVVRSLATRGRERLSGTFRAAVFGANDGLVSNLALVLGIGATGVSPTVVLFTGVAGLLAGALSMGAGEYVSVSSQRELLDASTPSPLARSALPHLDLEANELALVYRARGESERDAATHAARAIAEYRPDVPDDGPGRPTYQEIGSPWGAALSSFCFFASGALMPVLPYAFGLTGAAAVLVAAGLVGIALLATGAVVGILSGTSPISRAIRQLTIGYGAAGATYLLGLAFGTTLS